MVGTHVAHLTRGGLNLAINGSNMTVGVLLAVVAAVSVAAGITAGGGKSDKPAPIESTPPSRKADSIVFATSRAVEKPIAGHRHKPTRRPRGIIQPRASSWAPTASPRLLRRSTGSATPGSNSGGSHGPEGMKEEPEDRPKILATGMTSADGRFVLTTEFDGHGYPVRTMVVKAPGFGLSGRNSFSETVKEAAGDGKGLTFRLRRPATIEGRLLTLAGAPAVGVKVLIEDFRDSDSW